MCRAIAAGDVTEVGEERGGEVVPLEGPPTFICSSGIGPRIDTKRDTKVVRPTEEVYVSCSN